ncbi:uncharacterized protein TNCV_3190651 [Trichonephila clavipes]|nr:uncharacterized protein TNCV_3190651 [Trichonephila clavipes]
MSRATAPDLKVYSEKNTDDLKNHTSPVFPKNIMLSEFDEINDCMAFWSCNEVTSSLIQKGAWVMCQYLDVDKAEIETMAEKLSNASNIPLSDFVWTDYNTCL